MAPHKANTPASQREQSTVRSLPFEAWSSADRAAWTAACHPSRRLKRGGAGAHLKEITLADLKRRYGYFLDFLDRSGLLDRGVARRVKSTPKTLASTLANLTNGLAPSQLTDRSTSFVGPASCSILEVILDG